MCVHFDAGNLLKKKKNNNKQDGLLITLLLWYQMFRAPSKSGWFIMHVKHVVLFILYYCFRVTAAMAFFFLLSFFTIYIRESWYTYRYTPTTTTVRTMGTLPGLVSHSGHFKFERRANRVCGLTLLSAYSRASRFRN